MNFIMKGIHAALEPLRYTPTVSAQHPAHPEMAAGDAGFIERIKYRRKVRRSIRELNGLSDATLNDIGVERRNIPEIVEETISAPGKRPLPTKNEGGEHRSADYPIAGAAAA